MASTLVAAKSEAKKSSPSAARDVDNDALQSKQTNGVPAGLPRFLSGVTAGGRGAGGTRPGPVAFDATAPLDQAQPEAEDGKTDGAKPSSGPAAPVGAAPAADVGQHDGAAGPRTPTPLPARGGAARAAHAASGPPGAATRGKAAQSGEAAPKAPSAHAAIAPAVAEIHARAAHARTHRPAGVPVASAQAAAITPRVEQQRNAATQTVANLDAAKDQAKGQVARSEFKEKLKAAIVAATPKPKTEDEADKLTKSGATDARATMRDNLASERDAATGPLKAQSAPGADLPPSSQAAPPQASVQPEPIGTPPAPVSPGSVVPPPLPPERLDYSSDREPTDRAMAENNISKQQLEKGNEPEFGKTLQARETAEQHEAAAATGYRQSEAKVQDQAQNAAQAELAKGLGAMQGARLQHVNQVVGKQFGTAAKNAAERQRITDTITGIKDKTRADVADILNSMETEADAIFGDGLARAEKAYHDTFEEEKGGTWTWLTTWGSDWEELIEHSLDKARSRYLQEVDVAIDRVADLVDGKLAAAKQRVADGRAQVDTFRNGLDSSVQHFADEAIEAVSADFDAMGAEIDQRRDALVDKLTQQYKNSYERMSAMEEKLREENKSLWQRIYDATVGLIKKILAFKDLLLSILAKAASVVVDIISDPIGFLGNLVSGVMQGLKNFMANIGAHLKKGLMEWLFGAIAGAGLQLPDDFDLKGIVSIVLQILGLTYANFRARAVAIVGESVVAALEKTAEIFKIIATEGISGLWNFIKEKVGDLKSMVLDAIFDFVKEKVIIAGITWIVGLLNPASAFFKACKAIYDIVMFFITRGSQIIDLVNAVIDSIASIAKGSLGVAATMVENALAKAIPVAIGFLASLLGLGDIGGTVRKTIDKAQAPIHKAIDWAIGGAVKLFRAAGGFIKGVFGGKDKKKDDANPHADDPEKGPKVEAGLQALRQAESERQVDGALSHADALAIAAKVQREHPVFKSVTVKDGGESWDYEYVASPSTRIPGDKKPVFENPLKIHQMVMDIAMERYGSDLAQAGSPVVLSGGEQRIASVEAGEDPHKLGAEIAARKGLSREEAPFGKPLELGVGGEAVQGRQGSGGANIVISGLGTYPQIAKQLETRGLSGRALAHEVERFRETGEGDPLVKQYVALTFGAEPGRQVIAHAHAEFHLAASAGQVGAQQLFGEGGISPVALVGFSRSERRLAAMHGGSSDPREGTKIAAVIKENLQRNVLLVYNAVKDRSFRDTTGLRAAILELFDKMDRAHRVG
ncbi:MAG TPA: hypothetical protein VLX44_07055 [Xanthobacteraceae bacterium]|nr:hypothetical protein [Xanthobacteraceae bacterium]